jgi:hypothetical protein
MRCAIALEEQAKQVAFLRSPGAERLTEEWLRQMNRMDLRIPPREFHHDLTRSIEEAECFFVGANICDLLVATADSYPRTEFHIDLLPENAGWCWFERGLPLSATPETMAELHAVHPHIPAEWRPDLRAIHWRTIAGAEKPAVLTFHYFKLPGREWSSLGYAISIAEGDAWDRDMRLPITGAATLTDNARTGHWTLISDAMRYIYMLFSFMSQEYATAEREDIHNRGAQRRLRALAPKVNQAIKVVHLRRPATKGSGEKREVEWSCCWPVRGHWRRQWYAKRARHEPKFISPYVKGDLEKPLRTHERTVYAVTR